MLNNLKNRTTLTLSGFQSICKLYIQDNLNSKSIDRVYAVKPGTSAAIDEDASDVRKSISKMDQGFYLGNLKITVNNVTCFFGYILPPNVIFPPLAHKNLWLPSQAFCHTAFRNKIIG